MNDTPSLSSDLKRLPLKVATAPENIALFNRYQRGDRNALEDLKVRNLPLVIRIATKYEGQGLDFDELVAEGSLGLAHAIDKWEPSKGALTTYAYHWIHQAMQRAIDNYGKAIRTPIHVGNALRKTHKARRKLFLSLGREPTDQELADEVGVTVEMLRDGKQAAQTAAHLPSNGAFRQEDGPEWTPTMLRAPDFADDVLDGIGLDHLRVRVDEALRKLTPREARAVRLRYGLPLDSDEYVAGLTLDGVGRALDVTRERARQILNAALGNLRPLLTDRTCDSGHETILDPPGIKLARLPCGCAIATAHFIDPQERERLIRKALIA